MDTERIREARLRWPFKPFRLTTTAGREFLVTIPEHLAVSRKAVIVADERTEVGVYLDPTEVASLEYVDLSSEASPKHFDQPVSLVSPQAKKPGNDD